MKYKYEFINHDRNLPIKIFLHNINKYPIHWHEDMELIFVLEGCIKITEGHTEYILKENDIMLINSNVLHSSEFVEQNITLVLQIDTEFFENFYSGFSNIVFECKSFLYSKENQRKFDVIRNVLAKIMLAVNKKEQDYILEAEELIFKLIRYFITHFKMHVKESNMIKPNERLNRIVQYINEHYMEEITLDTLADSEYLSVHYLSRYFKDNLGITFIKYLTSVRLKKSINDLTYTEKNIAEVALEYGFPNTKSYYKAFNEAFGMTPNAYRKQYQYKVEYDRDGGSMNYFELNQTQALSKLFSYLELKNEGLIVELSERKSLLSISLESETKPIKHNWRKLMTFGRAAEGLRAEFQRQITEVQTEIPFEYIRFHGIFCDDMMVYNEENGVIYYNFTYVDELFDFFRKINIKPFIEIGYMPEQLASNKEQVMFWWKGNVSFPIDINKWNDLVRAFVKHLISRYGLIEVRTWYFEIWNEPNFKNFFWYESQEMFFDFYGQTLRTIKSVDSCLQVGGPAILLYGNTYLKWCSDLFEYLKNEKLSFEFFSFHIYPIEIDTVEINDIQLDFNRALNPVTFKYRIAENSFFKRYIDEIQGLLKRTNLSTLELHMTEWNSSSNSRDLVHDTCFMAAFLVDNVLKNLRDIDSMGFWTFTDIFEEFKAGSKTFHGGFGFITNNGIKKPIYYAYSLLNKLGNEIIEQGEGYIVTKKGSNFQILLYNYCHYDELYKHYETSHITHLNRYSVFEKGDIKKINLSLDSIKKGIYTIKTYKIDRDNGSAFDEWVKMGAPDPMNSTEVEHIKKKSIPYYATKKIEVSRYLDINEEIQPHGIILVELVSD